MFPIDEVSSDTVRTLFFAVCCLGLLVLAGVVLRLAVPLLRRLFIPAALLAGFLGIVLGPYGVGLVPEQMTETWSALPSSLIAVVFAPMLLGLRLPGLRQAYRIAMPQLLFAYLGEFLMIGLPMLVCVLVLVPIWDVNPLFGTIIEVGWPGGHGTAAGMGPVYADNGWADGGALTLATATGGLVFGIVAGTVLINIAARRGRLAHAATRSRTDESDIVPEDQRPTAGTVPLNRNMIANLAFHGALIALAILIGWVLQVLIEQVVPEMPLFPLAMLGGGLVQLVLSRTPLRDAVDVPSLRAIQGIALDLLVVAAVASISLPVVLDNLVPLTILMLVAAATAVGVFTLAGPRLFRTHWVENAIVNFGTLTAVASVGLMLLRTADPELRTDASRAYAMRVPFSSPIIGGGLLTAMLPLLAARSAWGLALGALGGALVILVLARVLGFWRKPSAQRIGAGV